MLVVTLAGESASRARDYKVRQRKRRTAFDLWSRARLRTREQVTKRQSKRDKPYCYVSPTFLTMMVFDWCKLFLMDPMIGPTACNGPRTPTANKGNYLDGTTTFAFSVFFDACAKFDGSIGRTYRTGTISQCFSQFIIVIISHHRATLFRQLNNVIVA